MNIGLPGTGIGGLFYLMAALMMPLVELRLTLIGRSSLRRWRFVGLQWSIALAIVLSIWGTFEILAYIFPYFIIYSQAVPASGDSIAEIRYQLGRVFRVAPILIALPTLITMLLSVETLRFAVRRKLPHISDDREVVHGME